MDIQRPRIKGRNLAANPFGGRKRSMKKVGVFLVVVALVIAGGGLAFWYLLIREAPLLDAELISDSD